MIKLSRPVATLLFSSALLSCGIARADDDLIYHLNNHLEGLAGAQHLSYSEINNGVTTQLPPGSDLDTESGSIAAVGFSAGWQGRLLGMNRIRGGVDLQVGSGDATYNGYLQNLQTGALSPLRSTTNETFVDLQTRVGGGFNLMPGQRDLLTPYAGLGLTSWNRDLTGTGGYSEQYDHFNWRTGLQYQVALAQDLALSLDAGFGKTFSASMTSSIFSNTFDLGSSWMQTYKLGLRYRTSRKVYLGLDAWWQHYNYGRSPAYSVNINGQAGTVMEPDSKTVRDGLMAVIGFAYR